MLARNLTTSERVAAEVVRGTTGALAKEGLLRAGDASSYPRVEVEVLRIDEAPNGIAASAGAPLGRGHEVAVIARAVLRTEASGEGHRDTGDVRGQVFVARAPTLSRADAELDAATLAAARRAGRLLGESLAGHPIATEEDSP